MKTILFTIVAALALVASPASAQLLGEPTATASKRLGFVKPLDTINGEVPLPTVGGVSRTAVFKDSSLVKLTYNFAARGPTNYPRSKEIEDLMRKVIGKEASKPTREIKGDLWEWKTEGEKYYARYDAKAMTLAIGLTAQGG